MFEKVKEKVKDFFKPKPKWQYSFYCPRCGGSEYADTKEELQHLKKTNHRIPVYIPVPVSFDENGKPTEIIETFTCYTCRYVPTNRDTYTRPDLAKDINKGRC